MHSTNRGNSSAGLWPAVAGASRPRTGKLFPLILVLATASLVLMGARTGDSEKRLSIYSVAANYSLPLVQHEGRDYVGLLELLEPLGRVSAKTDGSRWRIRYNNVDGDFQSGKSHARIQNREVDFGGKLILENKRGLVPVASLNALLPRFLGGPVTLHESSGRLFIGSVATHFTASLSSDTPPRLIFHFSAPVNPSIANEPGTLRMTFSREPLVGPASTTLTFGSKLIPSATYSETNGSAVVTVNATIPVIASFGNSGQTIVISPTAAAAAAQTAAGSTGTSPSDATPPPETPITTAPITPPARRYFAVVDASHGGDDRGETLGSALFEKDVTVAFARSLRQELESRGITTLVLRDSDANLSTDQRAIFANADHAAIYIAMHAASSGHGVRVYTALLPFGEDDHGPFHSWTTAQHDSLPLSQSAASAIAAELQKRQVPVRALSAALRPLNNITGPAIAVEVAPQGSDLAQLTAPDYQQLVAGAVATAIASVKDHLGSAP